LRSVLKFAAALALLLALVVGVDYLLGWPAVTWIGVRLLYQPATLPDSQVVHDVPYGGAADPARRVDLYLPAGKDFPMVVFAHGGGWREGDKNLRVAGADVYANIGRFLAGQGVGTAVINYRLLSSVTWQQQIDDVAQAVVGARKALVERGGHASSLFLMGHSAGAQLVTRVALDPAPLARAGASSSMVCGVIPVSGAALDLTDQRTWDLGADPEYYRARFGTHSGNDWQKAASPLTFLRPGAPPFLVIYASAESKALRRQSEWLVEKLRDAEVPVYPVVVPRSSHERIVLALSRGDSNAGRAILNFVKNLRCWRGAS
jgi:acetyl esterase/lipase